MILPGNVSFIFNLKKWKTRNDYETGGERPEKVFEDSGLDFIIWKLFKVLMNIWLSVGAGMIGLKAYLL
jgi:hypothetical protein